MKISETLKRDFIIADLSAKDKPGILKEVCEFLHKKGVIQAKDELYKSLLEREQLGSTGIGENVAIPHAKSGEVDNIITLFGRSVAGIDFDSLDRKPVHFVCLLIAPSHSTGLHLKVLARISRLLKSEALRDGLLKAQDDSEIYSILIEEDAKFI
ncbi:MAG: PTS sugar transporter subunit IIA [Nitrospinales bacterium]